MSSGTVAAIPERDEQIRALRSEGLTDGQIAKQMGASRSVVAVRRRALGLPPVVFGGSKKGRHQEPPKPGPPKVVARRGPQLTHDEAEQAVCAQVDPELFFPKKGNSAAPARKICAGCDIRERCLEVAMANDYDGIWGGLNKPERRRLRRARPAAAREHGTARGYRQHKKYGEEACATCKAAFAEYQREHRGHRATRTAVAA